MHANPASKLHQKTSPKNKVKNYRLDLNSKPLLAVALVVLIIVVSLVSAHRAKTGSSDFDVYYYAAKSVIDGARIYTLDRHAVSESKSPYVYPPFFACWLSPITLFPIQIAAAVWNVINLALCFAIALMLRRISEFWTVRHTSSTRGQLVFNAIFLILFVLVVADNIAMAQVNILVFFFMMLAISSFYDKKDTAAGFWLGIASAIKLFPALFFVFFMIKRKWKALWGGLLAFIFCFVVFPSLVLGISRNANDHKEWLSETLFDHVQPKTLPYFANQLSPSHQELRAVLFRLVIDWEHREIRGGPNGRAFTFRTPLRLNEPDAARVSNIVVGLIFILLLFILWINRSRMSGRASMDVAFACLFSALLVLSPKVRSHYAIFLLFPWLIMLMRSLKCGQMNRGAAAAFLASALFYVCQTIKYCKFLGFGAWSALIVFGYFLMLIGEKNDHNKI